jgi:hypothetical protein
LHRPYANTRNRHLPLLNRITSTNPLSLRPKSRATSARIRLLTPPKRRQAAAAIPFKTGATLCAVFTAPATNTNQRIARPQQHVRDTGWPQRRAMTATSPYSMGHASAICTTTPEDANPKENSSKESASATPVALLATVHAPARPKPPWGVKTPLQLDCWRYFLDRLGNGHLTKTHLHVLEGIDNGFLLPLAQNLLLQQFPAHSGRTRRNKQSHSKEIAAA